MGGGTPFLGCRSPRVPPPAGEEALLAAVGCREGQEVLGVPQGVDTPPVSPWGWHMLPGVSCLAMHMPRGAGGMGGLQEGGSARCCCSWGLTAVTVTVPQSSRAWWGRCPAVGATLSSPMCPPGPAVTSAGPAVMLSPEGQRGTPKNEGHGGGSLTIPPAQGQVTAGNCPLGVSPHTLVLCSPPVTLAGARDGLSPGGDDGTPKSWGHVTGVQPPLQPGDSWQWQWGHGMSLGTPHSIPSHPCPSQSLRDLSRGQG